MFVSEYFGFPTVSATLETPQSVAGCVKLDGEEAVQLYQLFYKMLGALKDG